jgi:beta-galactosidase
VKHTRTRSVELDRNGITIAGRTEVLLCGSLFYFRIPEGSWEDRMEKIRFAGYNCIDVYFPWNFHEAERDTWDFSNGMRDIDRFLSLAQEHKLYVMARPGPYICSEWDGGGLPAYLFADGLDIRQNDAAYLARVDEWYRRVLPIIAAHQIDSGGSVILVQVENELDFFGCRDVPGYISALARSARSCGITVPLIACAGQNDLYGAWGEVADVVPSVNLYLPSDAPHVEEIVTTCNHVLGDYDAPLMVVEMGRDDLLMRRYLASGAELLGPYNQVSGFDFGFTTSVNNWGDPVSFQPSYYDFRSLVTPYGEIRPFVRDSRVLCGFIRSMGALLARATPRSLTDGGGGYRVHDSEGASWTPPVLALSGQDHADAVAVSNLSETATRLRLTGPDVSASVPMPARTSAFALVNVDLAPLGIPVLVRLSTAEPVFVESNEAPVIVWQTPVSGVVELQAGDRECSFSFGEEGDDEGESRVEVPLPDGRMLTMIGVSRDRAATVTGYRNGKLTFLDEPLPTDPLDPRAADPSTATGPIMPVTIALAATTNDRLFNAAEERNAASGALELEKNGILRGYGRYRAAGSLVAPVAVVLHDAADIVSLYAGEAYVGTAYPAGCHSVMEPPPEAHTSVYTIRAEIWGHSNFDDSRKPSLRISSLRGITGMTEVREIRPLPWWRTVSPAGGAIPYYGRLGGRLTTDRPTTSEWRTTLAVSPDDDSVLLRFDGIACEGEVVVNEQVVGGVDSFSPIVDISEHVMPGTDAGITVRLRKRHYAEAAGSVSALLGRRVDGWRLAGAGEDVLLADARRQAEETVIPVTLRPGALAWLRLTPEVRSRFDDHKADRRRQELQGHRVLQRYRLRPPLSPDRRWTVRPASGNARIPPRVLVAGTKETRSSRSSKQSAATRRLSNRSSWCRYRNPWSTIRPNGSRSTASRAKPGSLLRPSPES